MTTVSSFFSRLYQNMLQVYNGFFKIIATPVLGFSLVDLLTVGLVLFVSVTITTWAIGKVISWIP